MRRLLRWIAYAGFLLSLPGPTRAERWDLQYFYDKLDQTLAFSDIHFPSPQRGIAVGMVFERRKRTPMSAVTSNGGSTWDLIPLKEQPRSLFFLHERAGWMISAKGRLWKTADTGRTWTSAGLRGIGKAEPVRVFFTNDSRGWLLCTQKQVFETSDGGRSWKLLEISRKPDTPAESSVYTWGLSFQSIILLSGFHRLPDRRSGVDPFLEPDVIPLGAQPTDAILLHSSDGGVKWTSHVLPKFGETIKIKVSPAGSGLMLVRHPDSFIHPTELIGLDLKTLRGKTIYSSKDRWLTDIAFAGPNRALAVAIDVEGRSPFPTIPGRVRVLECLDTQLWKEMEVDYRAEGRNAVLAVSGDSQAWLATDTGMILRWAKDNE